MDAGTLGAISTVLVMIAFFGVCWWAFAPNLKKRFEVDAILPFPDYDAEGKAHEQNDHPGDDSDRRN